MQVLTMKGAVEYVFIASDGRTDLRSCDEPSICSSQFHQRLSRFGSQTNCSELVQANTVFAISSAIAIPGKSSEGGSRSATQLTSSYFKLCC